MISGTAECLQLLLQWSNWNSEKIFRISVLIRIIWHFPTPRKRHFCPRKVPHQLLTAFASHCAISDPRSWIGSAYWTSVKGDIWRLLARRTQRIMWPGTKTLYHVTRFPRLRVGQDARFFSGPKNGLSRSRLIIRPGSIFCPAWNMQNKVQKL